MRFGPKNLSRPTPESIDKWFDFGAACCALFGTAINDPKATFIGVETASTLSWILGLSGATFLIAKRFFGVIPTGKKTVPIEDVTVMEEKEKK